MATRRVLLKCGAAGAGDSLAAAAPRGRHAASGLRGDAHRRGVAGDAEPGGLRRAAARRARSGRSPARSSTSTARGPSPAPAARSSSSRRTPSSRAAPAGRASGSRSTGRSATEDRHELRHDAHRGALQPLRRPSRPRLRRRPEADRPALLHERRRAGFRAGGRLKRNFAMSKDPSRGARPRGGAARRLAARAVVRPGGHRGPGAGARRAGARRDRRWRCSPAAASGGCRASSSTSKGVKNAVSGYAGGDADTAHYHVVGSGRTGHAKAVRGDLRSGEGQLRRAPAGLLLGGARSDRAEPAGARTPAPSTARRSSRRTRRRRRWRRPTSTSSTTPASSPRRS